MSARDVLRRQVATNAPRAVVLLRLAIAFVFVAEGVQKFRYPDTLGVARFAKIGIPAPEVLAPFVGVVEIVGGVLVLVGLATRLAALALVVDMLVAITSTKLPILLGHGFWGFADPTTRTGFLGMAHEARTDIAMLLGCAFLVVVGAGSRSSCSTALPPATPSSCAACCASTVSTCTRARSSAPSPRTASWASPPSSRRCGSRPRPGISSRSTSASSGCRSPASACACISSSACSAIVENERGLDLAISNGVVHGDRDGKSAA